MSDIRLDSGDLVYVITAVCPTTKRRVPVAVTHEGWVANRFLKSDSLVDAEREECRIWDDDSDFEDDLRRTNVKRAALAKLTPEEREVLGLKNMVG